MREEYEEFSSFPGGSCNSLYSLYSFCIDIMGVTRKIAGVLSR